MAWPPCGMSLVAPAALQPSGAAGRHKNQVLAERRSLHDCRAAAYGRRPSSCCNPSGTDRKETRIPRRPSAGGERSPWSTLRYLTPSRRERPGRKYTGTRQLFCCALVPAAAACMCVCAVCLRCECGWRTHRRHLAAPPPTRQAVDLFVYVLARGFYGRSARAASAQRPPPLAPSRSLCGVRRAGPSSFWHFALSWGLCLSEARCFGNLTRVYGEIALIMS